MTEERTRVLHQVAASIPDPRVLRRPVRVGVDGVDGAGKTTFADALAEVLRTRGRHVLRASVDGFHRPADERYRRGRSSPEGFFLDSYDLDAFHRVLLDPLGPDHAGARRVRTAVHDGCPADPWDPASTRYREGQLLYLAACSPVDRADLVVDNADHDAPRVVSRRRPARR